MTVHAASVCSCSAPTAGRGSGWYRHPACHPKGRVMKQAQQRRGSTAILAKLTGMTLAQLRAEWVTRYGAAPSHRSSDLLRRVLAWRIQSDAHGGLDVPTRRLLEKEESVAPAPTPGMRLAREWEGQRHEVIVTDDGILYEGQSYGSLSEVARHITGQRWNGPRFFGLRQKNVR